MQLELDFSQQIIRPTPPKSAFIKYECPHSWLYEYGIFQENSDIRAHVGPLSKTVYVFRTKDMMNEILTRRYECKSAMQRGVDYITGWGPVVPCDLKFVRRILWHNVAWWTWFRQGAGETEKGNVAVKVISELMRIGRFPFWVLPEEVTDIKLDVDGTDIIVSGKWHTQVKCDFPAGPKSIDGCYGNLFIQTHECNPLGKH